MHHPDYNIAIAHFLGSKLYNLYKIKILKASKKIKKLITFETMLDAYCKYFSICLQAINYTGVGVIEIDTFKCLSSPSYLLIAYNLLRNVKASPGVDEISVKNVTLAAIINLSKLLQSGSYKPKPTKRIFIKKSNGKMRPLGIPSAIDKVVQKGMLMLLEPFFEKVFLNCSHGFRKNRSCHSALNQIYHEWRGIRWFIECDFEGCFDNVSHPILLNIFSQHIKDRKISMLILKFLKGGFIDFSNLVNSRLELNKGTPQGGILSPLLCNILLHQFDMDMLKYINSLPKYDSKKNPLSEGYKISRRSTNTPWEGVYKDIKKLVHPSVSKKVVDKAMRTIRKRDASARGVHYRAPDPGNVKIQYVRYADDFIIGLISNKKFGIQMLRIIAFLA